jgi:hypothetical protein
MVSETANSRRSGLVTVLIATSIVLVGGIIGFVAGSKAKPPPSSDPTGAGNIRWTLEVPLSSNGWSTDMRDRSPRYVLEDGAECIPQTSGDGWNTIWDVGERLSVTDGTGIALGEAEVPDRGTLTGIRFGLSGDSRSRYEVVLTAEQRHGAACQITAAIPLSGPAETYVIHFENDPYEMTFSHQDLEARGLISHT